MARRSKFAAAAEDWFRTAAPSQAVSSADLWEALCAARPDLTTPSESRKTPKATCMRDLRNDGAFVVAGGTVTFTGT